MGLEKVNSPATGTIVNTAISPGVWTAMATGLTKVISWELVSKDNTAFRYAFTENPTTWRTNDGSGISKDTAITDLYVYLETGDTMELELWRL